MIPILQEGRQRLSEVARKGLAPGKDDDWEKEDGDFGTLCSSAYSLSSVKSGHDMSRCWSRV